MAKQTMYGMYRLYLSAKEGWKMSHTRFNHYIKQGLTLKDILMIENGSGKYLRNQK